METTELVETIAYEDVLYDDNVNYDISTLVLQALQIDPREVQVNNNTTVSDFYFYHFQEQSAQNDHLFQEMINHAAKVLCIQLRPDSIVMELCKTIEKSTLSQK